MENETHKNTKLKHFFLAASRVVGTFLCVFFMMATIMVFTADMRGTYWMMPYFVLPASMACITFGMNYWIADDPVRRKAYWISTIISVVLVMPLAMFDMWYFATSTALGFFATIILPVVVILYSIVSVRKKKSLIQATDASHQKTRLPRSRPMLRKTIRVVTLLSICCLLFENWYRVILYAHYHLTKNSGSLLFPGLIMFPLSILSAILLARFIKAEFVQRDVPKPEAIEQR